MVSLVLIVLLGVLVLLVGVFIVALALSGRDSHRLKGDDTAIRRYFDAMKSEGSPLEVIDETPRLIEIGTAPNLQTFLVSPLKYRQITRLCVLFAKVLDKLKGAGLDLNNADELLAKIIELCEDDFFRALSYVLFYAEHPAVDDPEAEAVGASEVYDFVRQNATLNQLAKVIEVIVMQNNVQRAIESFGRLAIKKKGT